jgi:hypothetical protein
MPVELVAADRRPVDDALEPSVGVEPTTFRLQGGCSTAELQGRRHNLLDRVPCSRRLGQGGSCVQSAECSA